MTNPLITPENNGVRFGLFTGATQVLYTIIAVFAGFFANLAPAGLNILILTAGICGAIIRIKRARDGRMPYLQGFGTGIVTAIVASVTLGFFFILLSIIKPSLLDQMSHARDLFGEDLSSLMGFLTIILMGSLGGVIISLVAMQYFKSPDHKPVEGIE